MARLPEVDSCADQARQCLKEVYAHGREPSEWPDPPSCTCPYTALLFAQAAFALGLTRLDFGYFDRAREYCSRCLHLAEQWEKTAAKHKEQPATAKRVLAMSRLLLAEATFIPLLIAALKTDFIFDVQRMSYDYLMPLVKEMAAKKTGAGQVLTDIQEARRHLRRSRPPSPAKSSVPVPAQRSAAWQRMEADLTNSALFTEGFLLCLVGIIQMVTDRNTSSSTGDTAHTEPRTSGKSASAAATASSYGARSSGRGATTTTTTTSPFSAALAGLVDLGARLADWGIRMALSTKLSVPADPQRGCSLLRQASDGLSNDSPHRHLGVGPVVAHYVESRKLCRDEDVLARLPPLIRAYLRFDNADRKHDYQQAVDIMTSEVRSESMWAGASRDRGDLLPQLRRYKARPDAGEAPLAYIASLLAGRVDEAMRRAYLLHVKSAESESSDTSSPWEAAMLKRLGQKRTPRDAMLAYMQVLYHRDALEFISEDKDVEFLAEAEESLAGSEHVNQWAVATLLVVAVRANRFQTTEADDFTRRQHRACQEYALIRILSRQQSIEVDWVVPHAWRCFAIHYYAYFKDIRLCRRTLGAAKQEAATIRCPKLRARFEDWISGLAAKVGQPILPPRLAQSSWWDRLSEYIAKFNNELQLEAASLGLDAADDRLACLSLRN
ncbi:unnamed protein product [Vitrella brassicaformis CCMP3155]|uniref:Uncharacterized protein n=1 Tax=Vitrella brassicaformis (strain CCMP3155) TaxID=1169540 RepID=A0A0G4FY44_VITBC|nr:unnamed protein product [Vitrella brassicaformis CCMP3155]|eukprot:CEM20074.1 unnamed protein product [Vitrella brassicaformis CCMP3155]